MSDKTKIEWTDATWNPITGCSVVSAGCKNCYAMKLAGTRLQHDPSRIGLTQDSAAGPVWNGQVRFNEHWLEQPLHWRRPRQVFVCAHGDLFHEAVPDEWIDRVFDVMRYAPHHTFQVLTKRPARMHAYLTRFMRSPSWDGYITRDGVASGDRPEGSVLFTPAGWPLPNVWLGVSVENQVAADERIPWLLQTPAAIRWISAEPLLGRVDLFGVSYGGGLYVNVLSVQDTPEVIVQPRIDWVVVGGESGAGARPMHPEWARSLRNQCAAAGVPFFFKQWGEFAPTVKVVNEQTHKTEDYDLGGAMTRVGKKAAGRLLDGVEHNG